MEPQSITTVITATGTPTINNPIKQTLLIENGKHIGEYIAQKYKA